MNPGGASARHQRHGPSARPRAVGRHRSPAAIVALLTLAATALGCGANGESPSGEAAAASPPATEPEFTAPIVFQRFANTGATPTIPGFYGGADIWIMEGDGSGVRLVRKGVPQHLDHPSLTFDLKNVVYAEFTDAEAGVEAGARIFREDLATGEREVLREVESCAVHHASISPITRQLVYARNCPEGDGFNKGLILELNDRRQIDASNTTTLGVGNGVGLGRAVLFQAEDEPENGERRMEIAIIRFDGYGQGTYTALTDREHRHRRPAVSPDGHESDRSGNWEIWKIEIETGQVVQLTDDPAYVSTRPRW